MNKKQEAIMLAYNKGYRVNQKGEVYSPSNKKLNPWIDDKGYYSFSIVLDDASVRIRVHRLLAYQLFGSKIFKDDIQVRHLDGDCLNNTESNLALGSASDNSFDRPKPERVASAINAASHKIKYDWDQIRKDRSNGMSYNDLMKKYKITSKGTLSYQLSE